LDQLIPATRQRLAELGAPLMVTEAEGRLALAERKIGAFERRYRTTLDQLQGVGLPDDAGMEMDEDFVERSGWQRTREEARQTLDAVQPFLEKPLGPPVAG